MELRIITGVITAADGTTSEFSISENGWYQWGADRARLGESVEVIEALSAALTYAEWEED